jgi:3-deoxy-D-manno-octulosonic-acid transferase
MRPWLRVPYTATARLAEVMAALAPATPSSKLGKTFAARRRLLERYGAWGSTQRDMSRPLLWVHAPSVGEGLMALPVIQRVQRELPEVQLAYTFFSPSAAPFAEQVGADFTAYLPFDTVGAAEEALTALRPTAIVFSKLDVWPLLVERARQREVLLGLISASMPAQSSRHGIGALLTREAYMALDWVGAASAEDAAHLIAAGARPACVQVTGDTRYDQAWTRTHTEPHNRSLVEAFRSSRPTLVAGSTWEADERHLFPAWERLVSQVPNARLILAPHELQETHLRHVETWAQQAELGCARLGAPDAPTADVVLVDRLGVLADLYALGDAAYVGGGFHTAGLHSVVEPAVLQVPVIVGPRHGASRDARLMLNAGGAVAVGDSAAMREALERLLTRPEERSRMAKVLEGVVAGQMGATVRSFEIIRAWMTQDPTVI